MKSKFLLLLFLVVLALVLSLAQANVSECVQIPDLKLNQSPGDHVSVQLQCDKSYQYCELVEIVNLGVDGHLVSQFSPLPTECLK